MMENGLNNFYKSQFKYLKKLINSKLLKKEDNEKQNEDIQPVTMEQMIIPLVIVLICSGAACFAFIMEIIMYRLMNRRNGRVGNRPN